MTAAEVSAVAPGVPRPGLGPLVAAAVSSVLADGFRIVAFILGAMVLSALIAGLGASGLVEAAGGLDAFGGVAGRSPAYAARMLVLTPIIDLLYALTIGAVVAYVGMQMPPRMTAVSTVPERTIRRGVALVGAVLLAGLTWFVLPMHLSPMLAIGVTLLPLVFALAALRGPRRPPIARDIRRFLVLTLVLVVGSTALLGIALTSPTTASDLSAFGEPASAAGLHPDTEWHIRQAMHGRDGMVEGWTSLPDLPPDELARITAVRTLVLAAEVRDGRLLLGDALADSGAGGAAGIGPEWAMPAPKTPRLVAIFTVATLADGRQVILDPQPTVDVTPAWDGRLFDYWFGA